MPEIYLSLLDRILTPVLLMLAVVFLLAGHNAPGGGFIAGLVVATAFLMQILARGDQFVRRLIGTYLQPAMGVGLLIAVFSALLGIGHYGVFFQGIWWKISLGDFVLELGSPTTFDIGVFMVVSAFVTSYLLELSRPAERANK
ncbi:MAG: MnhB domain-containing protein [Anaerolineales bacterium]|nr:MAG: MnhB domain-containing protein [Anaerolineales bacterium]